VNERIPGRKNYPTKEIDPENFIKDEDIKDMIKHVDQIKFVPEDFKKLYNCVHCGECPTEEERIQLKREYLKQVKSFEGWEQMQEYFKKYRTPYPSNTMRIRIPEGIPKESDTLFFMGCLSTIRIPRYTEHAVEIDTCKKENLEIFSQFKRIICLCPACFYLYAPRIKKC